MALTLVNPQVTELTGLTEQSLLGKSLFEVVPGLRATPFEAELAVAAAQQVRSGSRRASKRAMR